MSYNPVHSPILFHPHQQTKFVTKPLFRTNKLAESLFVASRSARLISCLEPSPEVNLGTLFKEEEGVYKNTFLPSEARIANSDCKLCKVESWDQEIKLEA